MRVSEREWRAGAVMSVKFSDAVGLAGIGAEAALRCASYTRLLSRAITRSLRSPFRYSVLLSGFSSRKLCPWPINRLGDQGDVPS